MRLKFKTSVSGLFRGQQFVFYRDTEADIPDALGKRLVAGGSARVVLLETAAIGQDRVEAAVLPLPTMRCASRRK